MRSSSGSVAGKLPTIARPFGVVLDDQPAAGTGDRGQHLVEPAVEFARQLAPSFALCGSPPYEALNLKGEVLASRR